MKILLYITIVLVLLAFSPWNSEPFELVKLMLFVSALMLGLGASTLGKLNYSLVLSLKKFFEVRVAFFALLAVFLGLIIFYGPWMQRWFSSDMLYAKSLKTNDENFVLKAQELNPKQTDYKLFAGTLLFEKVLKETENKEKQQDAAAKFEQLLKLEPNNSDARFSLALALEKQGDKIGAIRELERV